MITNKMVGATKTNIVIGLGQIGTAIKDILGCDGIDKDSVYIPQHYDVMHVCIPALDNFIDVVNVYKERFTPDLIIVHSTVPVGTCKKLGAVHSPCRGIHPVLKEGIMTFVKYFGGERAEEASEIFKEKGIKVKCCKDSNTIEALKLWDTTQYGLNIVLEKEIYKYCQENGLDFDLIYTDANTTYNSGYEELGHPEYKKYILKHKEGKIGGHCVLQNLPLLKGLIADFISDYNDKLRTTGN
jgi:UDP-N-acetyl-D-mannosaminuronate dehydrogenase